MGAARSAVFQLSGPSPALWRRCPAQGEAGPFRGCEARSQMLSSPPAEGNSAGGCDGQLREPEAGGLRFLQSDAQKQRFSAFRPTACFMVSMPGSMRSSGLTKAGA